MGAHGEWPEIAPVKQVTRKRINATPDGLRDMYERHIMDCEDKLRALLNQVRRWRAAELLEVDPEQSKAVQEAQSFLHT